MEIGDIVVSQIRTDDMRVALDAALKLERHSGERAGVFRDRGDWIVDTVDNMTKARVATVIVRDGQLEKYRDPKWMAAWREIRDSHD